jgi:hypothetical protein
MKNGVFMSYRREDGSETARAIWSSLKQEKFKVFLDVENLGASHFDDRLLLEIEEAPHFVLILSPGSLARCSSEGDWLRREVAHAIQTERNIVPVMLRDFEFPSDLPENISQLGRYNAVTYSHEYYGPTIQKIVHFLKTGPKPAKIRKAKGARPALRSPGEQAGVSSWAPAPPAKDVVPLPTRVERESQEHESRHSALTAIRTKALDRFDKADFAGAEPLFLRLLAERFEIPGTRCHLARVCFVTDRDSDAYEHATVAWAHRTWGPPDVVPRILWFHTALALLHDMSPAGMLGCLKTAFQAGNAHADWILKPVLDHLQPRLTPEAHALLAALSAAIDRPENLAGLDEFSEWKYQRALPFDQATELTPAGQDRFARENNRAVEFLRTGKTRDGLAIFNQLLFPGYELTMRVDVPVEIQTNFVSALAVTQNVEGSERYLAEVRDQNDPRVLAIRAAINKWRESLTGMQRLGLRPKPAVPLGDEPWDLI